MASPASSLIEAAKKTVNQADSFEKSAGAPPKPAAPTHEYSSAPYSMVSKMKKKLSDTTAGAGAGSDAASGIKARQANVDQYLKSAQ